MDYFNIVRTNRDKEIIQRLSNPINSDAYTESSRDDLWNRFVLEYQIELQKAFEEELEDWELDNLLDGQEDDTVDETIEPLYTPQVVLDERKYSKIPKGFNSWTKLAQSKWIEKSQKVLGRDIRKDEVYNENKNGKRG